MRSVRAKIDIANIASRLIRRSYKAKREVKGKKDEL